MPFETLELPRHGVPEGSVPYTDQLRPVGKFAGMKLFEESAVRPGIPNTLLTDELVQPYGHWSKLVV